MQRSSLPTVFLALAVLSPAAASRIIPVPSEAPPGTALRFPYVAGTNRAPSRFDLSWGDDKDIRLSASVQSTRLPVKTGTPPVLQEAEFPDPLVRFAVNAPGWPRIDRFIRPNAMRYGDARRAELRAAWESFPRASGTPIRIEFRNNGRGWEFWLDDCFAGSYERDTPLKTVTLTLAEGATAGEPVWTNSPAGLFLPLDMRHIVLPGSNAPFSVSWKSGFPPAGAPPLALHEGGLAADVARVRECRGSENLESDEDLSRTPFDAMPEHLHYSVPKAQYIRAWVLASVDDEPGRDPVLTARLTRFARGGRGEAIADTSVTLPRPGEKPGAGIIQAGTVNDGAATAALWLCEIPLPVGEIQDLLWGDKNGAMPLGGDYLDFEFLGKLDRQYSGSDRRHKPDPKSVSAVRVHAVTLEKAPVEMEARQVTIGNVFQRGEDVRMEVALRSVASAASARLDWAVRNLEGRILERRTQAVRFAGETGRVVTVALPARDAGWYGIDFTLSDGNGREWVRHPASYVLLEPDTRRAGYESPYSSWWFGFAHLGSKDPAVGGPLLQKMGVRRTTLFWHDKDLDEAKLAPWGLTLVSIPWMGRPYRSNDWAAGSAQQVEEVRALRERFPHCTNALLFHEGYPTFIVPELRDARPAPEELALNDWDRRILKLADVVSDTYRKHFPEIRIQFGNTTYSSGLIALLMRNGFPRDRFDCLGLETVGLTRPPEASVMVEAWLERETLRKFGHDAPVTACHEFTVRDYRLLGPARQAEWRIRDSLVGFGLGFTDIPLSGLYDPGNSYYNSLWGSGGCFQRYPLLYPRPVYAAGATLTRVLDQAVLKRAVPTGSRAVFVLEFERPGGEAVYALWAARGRVPVTLEFDRDIALTETDLYGKSRIVKTRGRKLKTAAGEGALYLSGAAPGATVTLGTPSFPGEEPPARLAVADQMEKAEAWTLRQGKDFRMHDPQSRDLPLLTDGAFALREARDPEKGNCLELELKREGVLPDLMHEYVSLTLKHPAELPGQPDRVGLWVKGNASGGRIRFEFQDAEGERWLSGSRWQEPGRNPVLDFDGWCFLRFPIVDVTRRDEAHAWTSTDDGVVQYPIRLVGLLVEYPRKALNLGVMEPVDPVIRMSRLVAWEEE